MVEWSFFTNPSHGQKYTEKFRKYEAVEVLHECAAIRLKGETVWVRAHNSTFLKKQYHTTPLQYIIIWLGIFRFNAVVA